MKTNQIKKNLIAIFFSMVATMVVITSCKREDKINPLPHLDQDAAILLSKKITTAPKIDGVIEPLWANIPVTEFSTVVPDLEASYYNPGCKVFAGYEGKKSNVKMRSVFDANNIYFLVEWDDPTESKDRNSWYFNPSTKRWMQESTYACANGSSQPPHYEDKFSIMWNINTPTEKWNTTTCYSNCHTGLKAPFKDAVKHYTSSPNEKVDVWHWKYVRTNEDYQLDDQYWGYADPSNPPGNAGRFSDAKTSGGYGDNKQDLKLSDDSTVTVTVPKYVIPGKTNHYWFSKAEIDAGTAKLITSVNSAGILTFNGGTIDPNGDSGYTKGTGAKRMASIFYQGPFVGGRGDVKAYGKHTGTGWVLEISRKLNTGDDKDVIFDGVSDYYFGVGVFENAGIAHSIKSNLKLTFEK